ncbi:hypothetical protein OUZ56_012675 [Daphnia magna]|uniref:Uncharacterized protein n=1 Tax=Daphnia magna TaxID=35525 RepID=A0ABQ9Z3Q7_9CRUS|nr:hypothetical protein OUZ56_012675 [Daphnia magna]
MKNGNNGFTDANMATAVNEAGPDVVSESEVEPDGDALLYCEALLSSEALLSDDADPAESAGSPAEESGPSPHNNSVQKLVLSPSY